MRRYLLRVLWVAAGLVILGGAAALALGGGHSIGAGLAENHPDGFDFVDPEECDPAPRPSDSATADKVVVRYLGAGGLYVEWRGQAILLGPFFSNPGKVEFLRGPIRFRWGSIRKGLEGMPMERVGAILAGHSHYDHIGDLPVIAGRLAPWTRVYVNRSGANAFEPFPRLRDRTEVLDCTEGKWVRLQDARRRPLPFRLRVLRSSHAPHVDGVTLMKHTTEARSEPWGERRYCDLGAGQPYALVIDLLDPDSEGAEDEAAVRYRIHYQDSASAAPDGIPPRELLDRPYDLAVVCMASAHLVRPYPAGLVEAIRPRHVLVTHYDDFFRPWEQRRGFVSLLSRRRAEAFLRRVEGALPALGTAPPATAAATCGPSAPGWTMPLVGEWIAFRPSPAGGAPP
ncbi:MAG TPA: hypothetical protein VM599_06485 [Thermoanaerobaculia bacterium]|nr:hypothetical protein [Thermoanaerobaculia bacterium]